MLIHRGHNRAWHRRADDFLGTALDRPGHPFLALSSAGAGLSGPELAGDLSPWLIAQRVWGVGLAARRYTHTAYLGPPIMLASLEVVRVQLPRASSDPSLKCYRGQPHTCL